NVTLSRRNLHGALLQQGIRGVGRKRERGGRGGRGRPRGGRGISTPVAPCCTRVRQPSRASRRRNQRRRPAPEPRMDGAVWAVGVRSHYHGATLHSYQRLLLAL